jgi:hypothetical protein
VLEPTRASRLAGDFRTGKRLAMRKVIAYIASHFRKDKIWLRRTRPDQRTYQARPPGQPPPCISASAPARRWAFCRGRGLGVAGPAATFSRPLRVPRRAQGGRGAARQAARP